jgi:hypothetical protein
MVPLSSVTSLDMLTGLDSSLSEIEPSLFYYS